MNNEIQLGTLAGLRLTAGPSALVGCAVVWVLLTLAAVALLRLPLGTSILAALAATALHWLGDLAHHLGHATAARRTGHPMSGVHFWGMLSSSVYPPGEPPLPAAVHIRRALGGPAASLLIAALAAVVLLLMPQGSVAWWVTLFFTLDNLLVFTIGSLMPLGFTDGGTLLRWWGK